MLVYVLVNLVLFSSVPSSHIISTSGSTVLGGSTVRTFYLYANLLH